MKLRYLAGLVILVGAPLAVQQVQAMQALTFEGTWHVTRECLSDCPMFLPKTAHVTQTVQHMNGNVYSVTSGNTKAMFLRIGDQFLGHGTQASSLLNIEAHGSVLRGTGVGENGATFSTVWRR